MLAQKKRGLKKLPPSFQETSPINADIAALEYAIKAINAQEECK